jgi:hypothetical protein
MSASFGYLTAFISVMIAVMLLVLFVPQIALFLPWLLS